MSHIVIRLDQHQARAAWSCVAIAVVVPVSILSLVLLYTTGVGDSFGYVNDVGNGLVGVLCAVLSAQTQWFGTPVAAVASAGAGAVFLVVGTWLTISGRTGWVLAGLVSTLGISLVGVWLIAANRAARRSGRLPRRLTVLGEVTGWVMAAGVLTGFGVLARRDAWEDLGWTDIGGFLSWFGFYLGLPVWSALVARALARQRRTG